MIALIHPFLDQSKSIVRKHCRCWPLSVFSAVTCFTFRMMWVSRELLDWEVIWIYFQFQYGQQEQRFVKKKYGGQKLKKTRDLHHSLLCNTDTGYCFTQYNIFCTKLDSKCVKLKSTRGKYAVNSYGKAYSMIRKLGSSVGLFVTCEVDVSCRWTRELWTTYWTPDSTQQRWYVAFFSHLLFNHIKDSPSNHSWWLPGFRAQRNFWNDRSPRSCQDDQGSL